MAREGRSIRLASIVFDHAEHSIFGWSLREQFFLSGCFRQRMRLQNENDQCQAKS